MFKRKKELVNDILRIVSIKSFTQDQKGLKMCQKEYQKIAERMGFKTYYKANEMVLIVEPQKLSNVPDIGMVVHLDTVPFTRNEWNYNPLGEFNNGRIFGRGVVDDKSAAVIALYAVYELKGKIKDSWQIIVGSDEEGSWADMLTYMSENPILPKFLFTIDGDGIQHGCRGYLDLELIFKRSTSTYNLSSLKIPNAVNNMVPGSAIAKVEEKIIYQNGKSVHSSISEEGINALVELALMLSKMEHVRKEFPKFFELMYQINDSNNEKSIGISNAREFTVTPVNCEIVSEEFLKLVLNIRLGVDLKKSEECKIVSYLENEYDCICNIEDLKLPGFVNPNSEHIHNMLKCYKEVLGKETFSYIAKGTGYNSALPNCVIFGPRFDVCHDEQDKSHMVDESRALNDLLLFMEMLIKYLEITL